MSPLHSSGQRALIAPQINFACSLALLVAATLPVFSNAAETAQGPSLVISPAVQKERDDTRQKILGDELEAEAKALTEAKAELQAATASRDSADKIRKLQESVNRRVANVEALNREMGKTPALPSTKSQRASIAPSIPSVVKSQQSKSTGWWDVYGRNKNQQIE